jgi:hypothetical protein
MYKYWAELFVVQFLEIMGLEKEVQRTGNTKAWPSMCFVNIILFYNKVSRLEAVLVNVSCVGLQSWSYRLKIFERSDF